MKEFVLSIFSLIASLLFVILFIFVGWYIVWRVFLCRFKFIRELIGSVMDPTTSTDQTTKVKTRYRKPRIE